MALAVEEITNVSRHIQEETTRMLWAVSAGICDNGGSNVSLDEAERNTM